MRRTLNSRSFQRSRRTFLGFGGGALVGSALPGLAGFTRTAGRTRLLLYNGSRDWLWAVPFQASLRRVVGALQAYGLRVTCREFPSSQFQLSPASLSRLPAMPAMCMHKSFVVHSGTLPPAFGAVLRDWFHEAPERLIGLGHARYETYAVTSEQVEDLCRQL